MRRRTVTFEKEIYERILKWRGKMLIESGMDINFTEAVNILLGMVLRNLDRKPKGQEG